MYEEWNGMKFFCPQKFVVGERCSYNFLNWLGTPIFFLLRILKPENETFEEIFFLEKNSTTFYQFLYFFPQKSQFREFLEVEKFFAR